jgi:predicted small secreted protein
MSWIQIEDEQNDVLLDHDGYGTGLGSLSSGDYMEFEIDNDTGTILGWKPITLEEIKNFKK